MPLLDRHCRHLSPRGQCAGLQLAPKAQVALAMVRGGASGRSGLWETSASGAAAVSLPGSAGPRSCTWNPTPAPTIPESRLPSLCRQLSQLVMLEHLSSLPTQMVRARPQDPPPRTLLWSWQLRRPLSLP